MSTLCTIGFTKKNLPEFMRRLQVAHVTKLVDIRLRNTSHLAGYAMKENLTFVLDLCRIEYEHVPELAPTSDILDTFRKDKDWMSFEREFKSILVERQPMNLIDGVIEGHSVTCLLCSEDKPDRCHRRLVAEYIREQRPSIELKHL